jgi:hypothetical protein
MPSFVIAFPPIATYRSCADQPYFPQGVPILYPLTAPVIKSQPAGSYPPSSIKGDGQCTVALANYNVLNLSPKSKATQFSKLADHIANFMNLPDVVGLEEIQDDNGATSAPSDVHICRAILLTKH